MIEYEYSFKVKMLEPYINYCKDSGFIKIEESFQKRVLYTNKNKILARITTKEINKKKTTTLDFKDENNSNEILKTSRETIPLNITEENIPAIISILDILGYIEYKALNRKRLVYKKDNITFEIDNYTSPETMYVVAIEGDKSKVDKIYFDIIKKFDYTIKQ